MGDPVSVGLIVGSTLLSAAGTGYAGYKQSQAQREAAEEAEKSARQQRQLALEQAPENASQSTSSSVVKKDEGIKGLRSTLLANNKKYSTPAPLDGNKEFTGQ